MEKTEIPITIPCISKEKMHIGTTGEETARSWLSCIKLMEMLSTGLWPFL